MCMHMYLCMYSFIYLFQKTSRFPSILNFWNLATEIVPFTFTLNNNNKFFFFYYFGIYSLIFSQQKSLSYILLPLPSHLLQKSTLLLNRCNTCFEINNIFSSFEVDKIVPNWRFTHLCMHDIILALHVFFLFFL